jgi:iron complex outermembrane receptor protein
MTGSLVEYKRDDHFLQKTSGTKLFKGWTIKGGVNYNISENISLFTNLGYYDKVQMLNNAFNLYFAEFNKAADNEQIKSFELGANYSSQKFSLRLNGYITRWENTVRTISVREQGPGASFEGWYQANAGFDANHMGIEMDFTYAPIKQFEVKGWMSLADWKWDKTFKNLALYYEEYVTYRDIDITGIYVGGAPQTQLGAQVRFAPYEGFYASFAGNFFDKLYSDFNPRDKISTSTKREDQAWQVPSYTLFDFHAGYTWKLPWYDNIELDFGMHILNIADTRYISASQDNAGILDGGTDWQNNDAASAAVFIGPPRRIMASLGIRF